MTQAFGEDVPLLGHSLGTVTGSGDNMSRACLLGGPRHLLSPPTSVLKTLDHVLWRAHEGGEE